jgi:hypothetical protein
VSATPFFPDSLEPDQLLSRLQRVIDMSRGFEVFRLNIILHCFPENEIVVGSMHRGKAPTGRRVLQKILPTFETEGYARRDEQFSTVWDMLAAFLSERDAVRFPSADYNENSIPDMSHRFERWIAHCAVTYRKPPMPKQVSEHYLMVEER